MILVNNVFKRIPIDSMPQLNELINTQANQNGSLKVHGKGKYTRITEKQKKKTKKKKKRYK